MADGTVMYCIRSVIRFRKTGGWSSTSDDGRCDRAQASEQRLLMQYRGTPSWPDAATVEEATPKIPSADVVNASDGTSVRCGASNPKAGVLLLRECGARLRRAAQFDCHPEEHHSAQEPDCRPCLGTGAPAYIPMSA